ncbi:MAG: chemotaxis protein CheX [Lachnospiraceae bacterium]|nr:chemotaxis protein CheX [Lachnospiraceae bacterium]
MHTQFFGNFLLNKGVITPDQLIEVLKIQSSTHKKIGTLAIHAGYMSAHEVEDVCSLQTRCDKRFGELAIELGYLTKAQVDELLEMQLPNYMLLGQILVEKELMTRIQFEDILTEYKNTYEIYDLDLLDEQKEMVDKLLKSFCPQEEIDNLKDILFYLKLLFNSFIRFIGEDFTPLKFITLPEVPTNYCVSQTLDGSFSFLSALDMEEDVAIDFACRYADKEFTEMNEYVQASIGDFLNLNNGLYAVNMSNDFSIELHLQPPALHEDTTLDTEATAYLLPIIYSFGKINFVISIL